MFSNANTCQEGGKLRVYVFHLSQVCPKLGVKESLNLHFSLSVCPLFLFPSCRLICNCRTNYWKYTGLQVICMNTQSEY